MSLTCKVSCRRMSAARRICLLTTVVTSFKEVIGKLSSGV